MQTQAVNDSGAVKPQINPAEMPPIQTQEVSPVQKEQDFSDISSVEADKIALEQAKQERVQIGEQIFTTLRDTTPQGPIVTEAEVEALEKNQILKEVEKAMMHEEVFTYDKKTGKIGGRFAELNEPEQAVFKNLGEEFARKIEAMIKNNKLDGDEVLDDITRWLRSTDSEAHPVSDNWAAQIAKIIKDKIISLAEQYKKDPQFAS
ncbi:MAG: hypothetical protein ACOYUZ_02145 [Patescibacteria group bacterium]